MTDEGLYEHDYLFDSGDSHCLSSLSKTIPHVVSRGATIIIDGKPRFKQARTIPCPRCQTQLRRGVTTLTFTHAPPERRRQTVDAWVCGCGEAYVSGAVAQAAYIAAMTGDRCLAPRLPDAPLASPGTRRKLTVEPLLARLKAIREQAERRERWFARASLFAVCSAIVGSLAASIFTTLYGFCVVPFAAIVAAITIVLAWALRLNDLSHSYTEDAQKLEVLTASLRVIELHVAESEPTAEVKHEFVTKILTLLGNVHREVKRKEIKQATITVEQEVENRIPVLV